jgi:hypothetical protein
LLLEPPAGYLTCDAEVLPELTAELRVALDVRSLLAVTAETRVALDERSVLWEATGW